MAGSIRTLLLTVGGGKDGGKFEGPKVLVFKDYVKDTDLAKSCQVHKFFYKQLHFPSQPRVAKEIRRNEAENCLAVAYVFGCFLHEIKENGHFQGSEAGQLLSSCLIFGHNLKLKLSN